MRFFLVGLSASGQAAGLRPLTTAQVRSGRRGRKLVRRFERMLRKDLRRAPQGGQAARIPLKASPDVHLEWFQPWSFAALGGIQVSGELGFTSAFRVRLAKRVLDPRGVVPRERRHNHG